MKFLLLAFFSLCFLACIEEYSDIVKLNSDGSATFSASIYPCEPDSGFIANIKENYESIKGLKLDSVWFAQRDTLYSLNFVLSFENLLSMPNDKKFEKDFVGYISLKEIKHIKNGYSFERIINPNSESENGEAIPEEGISPFALEQIAQNDSVYWEYSLVLPPGATLISSNSDSLRWKFPASEAISKRIVLKADFHLPAQESTYNIPLFGIVAGLIVMLLAIILLMRKLKKLSLTLRELKTLQNQREPESALAQDDPH